MWHFLPWQTQPKSVYEFTAQFTIWLCQQDTKRLTLLYGIHCRNQRSMIARAAMSGAIVS